jgi:lipoprotein-anchoring transpeptidase ErfK/SrfK
VSAAGTATVEQPWKAASKYSLAASIAGRVREVAASNGSVVPTAALIVDGARPAHLWDVASAASVARASGTPLLYVGAADVPPSTASALAAAGYPAAIVVGGTGAVSSALYAKVGAKERWSGSSRSSTAVSVARHAVARGWSTLAHVSVASTVPNAIVGGSLSGAKGGVLLFTDVARLSHVSWAYLGAQASSLSTAYAVGGSSIDGAQVAELKGGPSKPWFASEAPGKYVGSKARITGWVGGNATTLRLYVKGAKVRSVAIKPWGRFSFTSVTMPKATATVAAVSENPDGGKAKASRTVHRLKYPFATCIVIDKSQFKLYWVKNNKLERTFPVAIGRAGMETPPATWKILAKYHTSPGSVYGPRKMRLFRRSGTHWVFTRYGIHGTNQPWVIGTKASHGCIRMYNRDIRALFPLVKLGTMVVTRK